MSEAVITLGIGSDPQGTALFILFGLSPNVIRVRQKARPPLSGSFGAQLLKPVTVGVEQWQ